MKFRNLSVATFLMYVLRIDEWVLYYALLSHWYFEIVTLVVHHCGEGCDIPTLIGKIS